MSVSSFRPHNRLRQSLGQRSGQLISTNAQRNPLSTQELVETQKVVAETGVDDYAGQVRNTLGWVAAAGLFAFGISMTTGTDAAIEFVSGYVLEQSLSIDNLFVFLILFDYFKVEQGNQAKVLNYGIIGAVVLRGLFIAAGSVALEQFHQVLFVFAAVLFASSYGILFSGGDDEDENVDENWIVKLSRRYFKSTDQFEGEKFFNKDGLATPLFLCLVCIELSDVVFAFDSVPAIFGVTQDPFIVYTSNIFAISGLRSLYFVLAKAVSELKYLEKAVGLVLAFIGVKLAGEACSIELVTPLQSLGVVLGLLGAGVGASLSTAKGTKVDE